MNYRLVLLAVFSIGLAVDVARAKSSVRVDGRPNIIFIITDDHDGDTMGCFGGPVPTPHIDARFRGWAYHDRCGSKSYANRIVTPNSGHCNVRTFVNCTSAEMR